MSSPARFVHDAGEEARHLVRTADGPERGNALAAVGVEHDIFG
jgi:hypothetical protein